MIQGKQISMLAAVVAEQREMLDVLEERIASMYKQINKLNSELGDANDICHEQKEALRKLKSYVSASSWGRRHKVVALINQALEREKAPF